MGIVRTLSEPSLDIMLYGDNSASLMGYLNNQLTQMGPALNEVGSRIYNSIASSINFVTDAATRRGIYKELEENDVKSIDDYIREMSTFDQLREATPVNQRWIMCEPHLKQLYIDQNVEGYAETYMPFDPTHAGPSDYDYRRATDGLLMDQGTEWVVHNYLEELREGDRELEHFEKVMIANTHDAIRWMLEECKFDFTSTSEEPTKINR